MVLKMTEKPRWGIYIDIEGFGANYDETMSGLIPLNALMEGIYKIGENYYREPPDRLFAHQFGDGFIVVSDFHEMKLDRAIAVAISLMRYVLAHRGVAKASIAEGDFSDIQGCYPKPIRNHAMEGDGRVNIGHGLMTVFPVMGTALINAAGVNKDSPSGSLLTLHKSNSDRISAEFEITNVKEDLISINWIKGDSELVNSICNGAGLIDNDESTRENLLVSYIQKNKLKEEWIENTRELQNITT